MKNLQWLILTGLLIFKASYAGPIIPVANTTMNVTFDKRGVPASLYIWYGLDATLIPDTTEPGRLALTCLSTSDPTYGACPADPVWAAFGENKISLKFCNDSSTCKNLDITGYHTSPECPIFSTYSANACSRQSVNPFYYYIPQSSLSVLSPGVWTATLKQNLYRWNPVQQLATWTANITLKVTNTGAQTIYFPAFPGGNPRINLNLNNRPGTVNNTTASGTATLDMCLYDGGLSANNIALTFKDEGRTAPGRTSGYFSVYRDGGSADSASDRLDYKVMMLNPLTGSTYGRAIQNGTAIGLNGTAASSFRRRQVALPGISGVSSCVPVPITLVTPSFTLSGKTAGHYTGTLSVIYAPTTTTP